MVLPFLSIFFLISFIFVLEKSINKDGGDIENNENSHNKNVKKKDKKEPVSITTVFKLELHGQNCISKIKELVMKFEGVKNLSIDLEKDLVIVYSTKDVKALTERLRRLLCRSVEILQLEKDENYKQNERLDFLLKKNDNGSNNKNNHDEGEKRNRNDENNRNEEEKKTDVKGLPMTTAFKVNCQSCIDKIQKLVPELQGVMELSMDLEKGLVVVNGVTDDIEHLRAILRRPVEIVPHKKDKDGDEKDEKGSVTTTVFKLRVHCDRCIDLIRTMILRFPGVTKVDVEKDLVIVYGTMDVQALMERLEKILRRKDKKVMQNEEEKGPVTTTSFKVRLHCPDCIYKMEKLVLRFEGVTDISVDNTKDLITVTGTIDNIALNNYMSEKFKRRVEIVPPNQDKEDKQSNEVGNGDGDDGGGDGDNNSGGGDKNKKGSGGDGDSDGDGGDEAEGGGGGKMEAGFKLDYMGEGGFGYRYGYHAGFENGYPVGQLHVAHRVNGENLNDKEDNQSNEVGNGNGDGSGSDRDNNGCSGGDKSRKKGDHGGRWIKKTKDNKIICTGHLGFGDGVGQLLVAQMFCPGNLNACSGIRSVVLV